MKRLTWIDRFLSGSSAAAFVRVSDPFIQEFLEQPKFRIDLTDLEEAKMLILDPTGSLDFGEKQEEIQAQAEILYGLAHIAFLSTPEGIECMYLKQKEKMFRHCPRIFCKQTPCFPCGVSEDLGVESVKMFCPTCRTVYKTGDDKLDRVDGGYFGMSFVDILLSRHPDMGIVGDSPVYVPRIFGFRVWQRPTETVEEEDG
jgi:casein kinase II subunit beta